MSQPKSSLSPPEAPNSGWWWESALVVLLCYLKAGWPPPDVNEAHYLCKAKHYWNPAWGAGDFFLESADAHEPFYFVFGWVTLLVSLPAAAWLGRLVTWSLLAIAWQRLSWALAPVRFGAVISGGLMIVLTTAGQMAGEWIIGGVEGKGFAYALVFWGLERLVRNRWNSALVLFGGAAALHVLVGGWAVVAAGVAWLLTARRERPALVSLAPGLAGGFLLSLLGLAPAALLNYGVAGAIVREANVIYVYQRLPHHLVVHQFPHLWIARHVLLVVGFFLGAWWLLRWEEGGAWRRFRGFIAGAVAIAVAGVVIDQSTLFFEELAAGLLRFYWYRLADGLVPCGVALLLVAIYARWSAERPQAATWLFAALLLAVCGPLLSWNYARQRLPLPGAALQSWSQRAAPGDADEALAHHADWVAACRWIAEHTPPDAIFLTPRNQQSFSWYAERPEVVSVKDIPQDARGIVEWRRRLDDVFAYPVNRWGFAALSDAQMAELANRYGARYVIVDSFPRFPAWRRVYPPAGEVNENFMVFEIPPSADASR